MTFANLFESVVKKFFGRIDSNWKFMLFKAKKARLRNAKSRLHITQAQPASY